MRTRSTQYVRSHGFVFSGMYISRLHKMVDRIKSFIHVQLRYKTFRILLNSFYYIFGICFHVLSLSSSSVLNLQFIQELLESFLEDCESIQSQLIKR